MTGSLQPGSEAWLQLVTASKVSAILGLSPYESPRSLWHKMRGDIPAQPQTRVQARGTYLEAGILNWFFADHPEYVSRHGREQTVTRDDLPWAAATPDDIATTDDGEQVPVDAKTVGRDDGQWGEPGTDQVPLHLLTQAMWVMHLGGFRRFIFTRLGPFLDRADYQVAYNEALAADIEDRCRVFHQSLTDGPPPDLDGTAETYAALRAVSPVGEGPWECPDGLARDLCQARADTADAESRYNLARSRVLDAMGDAKQVMWRGYVLGQKQRTKNGAALYPPRTDIPLSMFATPDAPEATE